MKVRLMYLVKYYFFWVNFFIITKGIFLVYHSSAVKNLDFLTIARIFSSGFKLDISFAAYLSLLPFLIVASSVFVPAKITKYIQYTFTGIALLVTTFLVVLDLELYRTWHFRIDVTPLMYINTPGEMLASAGASPLLLLSLIFLCTFLLFAAIFVLALAPHIEQFKELPTHFLLKIAACLFFIMLAGALVVPIRGGLQQIPINQSMVYFSTNDFANHAAVNPLWNFFNSIISKTYEKENPYKYYSAQEASRRINTLYTSAQAPTQQLLTTHKPNVIVIIWESLTAKVIEPLNGVPGVTPNFSQLTKEGVFFNNLYASGNRSDKGIVAILSAFPAQPKNSIITIPNKTARLPYLSTDFKKAGYQTAFYYGGELEFANIKSYLLKGGFEEVIGKDAFDEKDMNSKWGAHDHIVFDRMFADINAMAADKPFFYTMFTLSSHEPFEVPVPTAIVGEDEQSKFLNAMHYADWSMGRFIEQAKKQPWWQNTLVVIVADHGHRLPVMGTEDPSKEFHIPMLWLGGALKDKNKVIDKLSSQIDIAPTILSQLHLPYAQYRWGKDIFNATTRPFAYFAFNDGFGFIQPDKRVVFDNIGKKLISGSSKPAEEDIALGKSYLQMSYQDYLDK